MEEIYPKGLLLFLHTDKASTVAWKVINSRDIQMRYMLDSDQTV